MRQCMHVWFGVYKPLILLMCVCIHVQCVLLQTMHLYYVCEMPDCSRKCMDTCSVIVNVCVYIQNNASLLCLHVCVPMCVTDVYLFVVDYCVALVLVLSSHSIVGQLYYSLYLTTPHL